MFATNAAGAKQAATVQAKAQCDTLDEVRELLARMGAEA